MEAHSCIGVITIFSGAISVFLVTISSICARLASVSSSALTTTSAESASRLTTASENPFDAISVSIAASCSAIWVICTLLFRIT